ncbi:MAG TPA: asparagine synthase-related protein, partial [Pseudodesulfovibrio sp.]|nr:asparagine synthase-related protein [Pseudodesulfovibrio sp.]
PFLHRPLVELALQLPVSLRMRPGAKKWILRESLRDVLPEAIRTRPGKGGIGGRVAWSFHHERRLLRGLILDSHLADLGCVDRQALASAFDHAASGQTSSVVHLMFTLALETWLAVRSGWWAANAPRLQSRGTPFTASQSTRKEHHRVEASVR